MQAPFQIEEATIRELHKLDAVDRIASVIRVVGRPEA